MTNGKTHKTAVVLLPPEEIWPPIQALREAHDRHLRRWMPHVNLLYPFVPETDFDLVGPSLTDACRRTGSFEVRLEKFRYFAHGRGRYTIYLAPEPEADLAILQRRLEQAVPFCDDQSRKAGGFVPHLSVGQARGRKALETLLDGLEKTWLPIHFKAQEVAVISRLDPPEDIFRVVRGIGFRKDGG